MDGDDGEMMGYKKSHEFNSMIKKQSDSPTETTDLVSLTATLTGLAGLLFGYDNAVISGAMLFIGEQFSLSPTLKELLVSVHLLGAVSSAPFGGILADRLGRHHTMLSAALILVVGSLATALATGTVALMVSRFIVGAGMSVLAIVAPLYTSELAPKSERGRLVARYGFGLTLGILVAYSVDYFFASYSAWRWMLGVGALPAILLAVGAFLVPETPRWLIGVGRKDEARTSLQRLRQRTDVEGELLEIAGGQRSEKAGTWSDLCSSSLRPALILGVGLAVFRAVSGFSAVRFYSPEIFQLAGFDTPSTELGMTVGIGGVMVCVAFLALKLIDRVGRKPLLIGGFMGMAVSMISLGVVLDYEIVPAIVEPWLALVSLVIFTASFGLGPAPTFRPILSEIYPTRVRGLGAAAGQTANSVANLLVSATFLTLIQLVGRSASFFLYGSLAVAASMFVYVYAPETKGRSLEEIEAFWTHGKQSRR